MNTDILPKQKRKEALAGSYPIQSDQMSGLIDSVLIKLQTFQNNLDFNSLCVGFTSCQENSGVTTIASRIAMQAARSATDNVLLVDANLDKPNIYRNFMLNPGPGLTDHMIDGLELEDCIQKTTNEKLHVMTWGNMRSSEQTISPLGLKSLFNDLRSRYEFIVLDLPTIESIGYGIFFANHTDGVILVLDGQTSRTRPNKHLVQLLTDNSVEIIGVTMNRYTPALPRWLRRWF